jgi:hypothetical protein
VFNSCLGPGMKTGLATGRADDGEGSVGAGIVGAMWEGPWDDEPPPARPPTDDAEAGPPDDGPDWTGEAEPGRWYRPETPRGKAILVVSVAVVLLVSVVGCFVGALRLSQLYALNPFGFPLLR